MWHFDLNSTIPLFTSFPFEYSNDDLGFTTLIDVINRSLAVARNDYHYTVSDKSVIDIIHICSRLWPIHQIHSDRENRMRLLVNQTIYRVLTINERRGV